MAAHYYTVTWDQLHRDARALAWRLIDKGPFTGIVAITRGGLIPAAIVARELECRLIESVSILTYDEEDRGEPVVIKPPTAAGEGTGFLIVDDLVDTGATARVVRGLRERLTKRDAYILDWVVLVHVEIAIGGKLKVKTSVVRKQLQHVIKKADSG